MNFRKKFSISLLIISMLIFVPASSYAIADLSVFGGYSFAGEIESAGEKNDVNGWEYGAYGHINTGIPMVLTVGLGGFYQIAPLKIKTDGGTVDATKKAVGIDAYAQLDLPVIPVKPFVRGGLAINEKVEIESETYSKNFNSSYFGFGVAYPLFSAVKLNLQLFAEYLYTTSKQEHDVKLRGNVINVGLKASI